MLDDKVHLLVSELPEHFDHPARGLVVVDSLNGQVAPLLIRSGFESGWGDAACTAPPAEIGSHGIQVSKRLDGRVEILVVNHAERESIEALELLHDDKGGYSAVWHGCVVDSTGLFNAVASTRDGGFIVTVMLDRATMARKDLLDVVTSGADTGYLVEWHPNSGLATLPHSAAPNNNGVQLSADGHFIFFNAWSGRQIRKYDRQAGRVIQVLDVPFCVFRARKASDSRHVGPWFHAMSVQCS